ncbi:MAG: DUF4149 domain-containing protein [Proteobacteria bacterium]|nr:DUF4149 domain-containing protein [Pseudomonadota bacterium]
MFDWFNFHVVSLIVTALLFGGMTSFAFFFTPMVFRYTEREDAAEFLRRVFPIYDRLGSFVAIAAALPLFPGRYSIEVGTLLAVAASFLFAARVILPAVNKAREAGDDRRFKIWHKISVILHTVQLIAVLIVLVRLAQ